MVGEAGSVGKKDVKTGCCWDLLQQGGLYSHQAGLSWKQQAQVVLEATTVLLETGWVGLGPPPAGGGFTAIQAGLRWKLP